MRAFKRSRQNLLLANLENFDPQIRCPNCDSFSTEVIDITKHLTNNYEIDKHGLPWLNCKICGHLSLHKNIKIDREK